MNNLSINIKPEFLLFLPKDKKFLEDEVNLALSILLFIRNKVTLAKAAELAGRSLEEFIEILKEHEIPWGEYTEEQYEKDLETIKYLTKE
ncbi:MULTISPECIES: UPF0175 family protein [unclassified Caloramator]|uniref:UPF0175 family protein n=1 Tax=unclassified Caloramator TaxID=2629145 RepID=UPI00237DDB9C|nr:MULTISPECIES: UPF0175 family protein [unclassified Caloramator]MDO6354761.1 UPF0175 family protein [Caloramator sp. CAR-1]WDU83550.1 UPF0175 family protein [Caloramator sp. Dgby_cultured_2]